jgi:hypothetical protein
MAQSRWPEPKKHMGGVVTALSSCLWIAKADRSFQSMFTTAFQRYESATYVSQHMCGLGCRLVAFKSLIRAKFRCHRCRRGTSMVCTSARCQRMQACHGSLRGSPFRFPALNAIRAMLQDSTHPLHRAFPPLTFQPSAFPHPKCNTPTPLPKSCPSFPMRRVCEIGGSL